MTGVRTQTLDCGGGMPAFVAAPDGAAKAPAVIVVHERYGLVRHTCDLAERFSRDGFVAIAPDLYLSTRTRTRSIAATPAAMSAIPMP